VLPTTNVYVEGELVDAVWPERKLVVELDGWNHHRTKGSFEEDRRRDSKLAVRHWAGSALHNRARYEPAGVVAELSELLRDGPGRRRARSGQ
jgi:very-short-patch-repair endonuclease